MKRALLVVAILLFANAADAQAIEACPAAWLDRAAFDSALAVELSGLDTVGAIIAVEECTDSSARIRVRLGDGRTDHRSLDLSDVSPRTRVRVLALMAADLVRFVRDVPVEAVEVAVDELDQPPGSPPSSPAEPPDPRHAFRRSRGLSAPEPRHLPRASDESDWEIDVSVGTRRYFARDSAPVGGYVSARIGLFVARFSGQVEDAEALDQTSGEPIGLAHLSELAFSAGVHALHVPLGDLFFFETDLLGTIGLMTISAVDSVFGESVEASTAVFAALGNARLGFAFFGHFALVAGLELGFQAGAAATARGPLGSEVFAGFDGPFAGVSIAAAGRF